MMQNYISEFPVLCHALGTLKAGDCYYRAAAQTDPDGVQIYYVGPNREELPLYPHTGGLPHDFKAEIPPSTTTVVLIKRAGRLLR
jgi:hypothetical protein